MNKIDRLLSNPRLDRAVHGLASGFNAVQEAAPRLASQFSTQQRWLMSHVALALYFEALRAGRPGFARRDVFDRVLAHGLASRNTASAFLAEALHYGLITPCADAPELAAPSPATLSALAAWYAIHFGALDALDDGGRTARLREDEGGLLGDIEPAVAEGLLSCAIIRKPPPLYAVFACVDEGGSLMDRLVAGLDMETAAFEDRAATDVTSVSALARRLNVSRTHAGRTLATAAAAGGLGWSGERGRSPIWLSRGFRDDYAQVQAAKLAIIDDALEAAAGICDAAMLAIVAGASDVQPESLAG